MLSQAEFERLIAEVEEREGRPRKRVYLCLSAPDQSPTELALTGILHMFQ